MSKFSEELGFISDAVEICEETLSLSSAASDDALESVRLMLQAQLLRLHAQFNSPPDRLRNHYRSLLQLSKTKHRLFQHVDVQHALILAEFRLLSPDQAVSRLKNLLRNSILNQASKDGELNESDLRLCYFDLLAEGLLATGAPWEGFPELGFQHLTHFEKVVQSVQARMATESLLVSSDESVPLAQRLTLLALSKMTLLTTQDQYVKSDQSPKAAETLQLDLLLATLSAADRDLWQRRLLFLPDASDAIQYDTMSGRLSYGATSLVLKGTTAKLLFEKLLEAHLCSRLLSTSDLAESIWQETYNLSHYERLRVSTQRLNASLKKLTARADNLVFNKSEVQLNPKLKVRRA